MCVGGVCRLLLAEMEMRWELYVFFLFYFIRSEGKRDPTPQLRISGPHSHQTDGDWIFFFFCSFLKDFSTGINT